MRVLTLDRLQIRRHLRHNIYITPRGRLYLDDHRRESVDRKLGTLAQALAAHHITPALIEESGPGSFALRIEE